MRPLTTALVASAFLTLFYVTMPSASAFPAPSRAGVTSEQTTSAAQQVHWRHGGWGYRYYRPYRFYRPYRLYRPHYYRGWGHRGCHRYY
jgi:hypothetical protein